MATLIGSIVMITQRYTRLTLYTDRLVGIVVGLCEGVLWGLGNGLPRSLPTALLVGGITAAVTGVAARHIYYATLAPEKMIFAESVPWSWSQLLRMRRGLRRGLLIGLLISIPMILAYNMTYGFVLGLEVGIAMGLITGIAIGVVLNIKTRRVRTKIHPNEGVRRSVRTAVTLGCMVMLFIGCAVGIAEGSIRVFTNQMTDPTVPLTYMRMILHWLAWGAGPGAGAALRFGGVTAIRHVVLRWILYRNGLIWNLYGFLEIAMTLGFINQQGSSYEFHEILRTAFAARRQKSPIDA